MFTRKNVIRACFAAVLAIGLAACGGGSSTPETPPPTQAEMDRTAIDGAISAATAAIDGLTAMSSDADVAAAQAAIVAAQAALDGSTALSLTEARALQGEIAATRTALGAKQTAVADYRTHMDQHTTAMNAVDAATAAIDDLTAMSDDTAVSAAADAIAAAKQAVADGTMLTAAEMDALNDAIRLAEANLTIKKTLVSDQQAQDMQGRQYAAVGDAIDAAMTAVGALTAMSSDADVAAAQEAIGTAQTALEATTVLPATDVRALQARIDVAKESLGSMRVTINDYRTHTSQVNAANAAVKVAEMAVGALDQMSSDADVTAAEMAIAAAKQAVMDGAMLTADEMTMLNGSISTAEMNLGTAKMAISGYRTHNMQYADAMTAVRMAATAVGALDVVSSDMDVAAAQKAIGDAEAAVSAGTMLTEAEAAVLRGRIALAKVDLGEVRMKIADHRTHQRQYTDAMGAVTAAETAVGGLTNASSDEDIAAAQKAIDDAKAAVMNGSMLTTDQVDMLNGTISTAEAELGTARMQIALWRERNTANDVARLFAVASSQMTAADNAREAAVAAGAKATKYAGMLDVMSVLGESKTAEENARMILDANDDAIQAVIDATAAQTAAQTAKTEATGLADGTASKTELLAALDAAISAAGADVKAAADIRDSKTPSDSTDNTTTLKTAVAAVMGSAADSKGTPKDVGENVADLVDGAFATGSITAVSSDTAVSIGMEDRPATLTDLQKVVFEDHHGTPGGMTFAAIVGEANLVPKTYLNASNEIVTVKSAFSVTGSEVSDVITGDSQPAIPAASTDPLTVIANGALYDEGSYKGIDGNVFCSGTDCRVNSDGELLGSWYFAPDAAATTPYIAGTGAAAGTYGIAMHVRYGHWMEMIDHDSDTTTSPIFGGVRVFAVAGSNNSVGSFARDSGVDGLKDASATYTGDARGMSVRKTYGPDQKQTSISSGAFQADVTLEAVFDDSDPSLTGTINNFRGMGVNANWSVTLDEPAGGTPAHTRDDSNDPSVFANGVTRTSGTETSDNGVWTANTYGQERTDGGTTIQLQADGVFGLFNANFRDGSAVGAYATRKQ